MSVELTSNPRTEVELDENGYHNSPVQQGTSTNEHSHLESYQLRSEL
jgi:hypothetical protein